MNIDENLIRHIARLSRIELSEDEIHAFKPQFEGILEYFGKLKELDTENTEPLTRAVEITNAWKEDITGPCLERGAALSNAPDTDGTFFKVPKVLGESQ